MSCQSCCDAVSRALTGIEGIKKFDINLENQQVVIESVLPLKTIQSLLESTGRKVIIKGYGSKPSSSAVAFLGYPVGYTTGSLKGVVRFIETEDQVCHIDGTLDGLTPGFHGLHIYTSGDLSRGCASIGEHYNPYNAPHGDQKDDIMNRHLGDLGNIEADKDGRAVFYIADKHIKLSDIIGRSLGITADRDDLGRGLNAASRIDGNAGERIGCGIIARSASVLENPKKICLCSGETIWEDKTSVLNSTFTPPQS